MVVVAQSCLTLCDPVDCSTPGLPVLHHLPEFPQTHVHGVADASQPSHPLLPPSPLALSSVQFSSVAQSYPTLCDPMNRSTPGLPVHHQLPEFTQAHVHQVSDAIQTSHPRSSPSPPAPNPSQHQSLKGPFSQGYGFSSSVQFSLSVVSDSLRPHESQHTRPPCPSPTPGVHSDSRPSSQ